MIRDEKMRPIVLLAAVTALCLVGDSMLYVVLPVHWKEFGLTALWEAGALLSVNRFVRLPLNPLVSRLYRWLSARSGMLLAAALAVVTTAGYGAAGSFAALLVLRALWGLAWTFLRLGAYFTVLTTVEESRQGRAMGLYNGLMRTGSLFGMLLGGMLSDWWGAAGTCLFFAAASSAEASAEEAAVSLLSQWKVLAVLTVGTAVAFVYQGMLISTMSYLVKVRLPDGLALGALTTVGDAVAAHTAVVSGAKIRVITVYSVLTDVGAAAGPAAAFALNQYGGPWASCWLGAALLLLSAVGYALAERNEARGT